MATRRTKKPMASGSAAPFTRSAEIEALARSCTRYLNGDGPRTATTLLASIPHDAEPDYYGVGGEVAALEEEVATLLGKDAALFVPSGTMAQQAVLRVHADRRTSRTVAFHPTCHLDLREERGYEHLHGLFGVPVGSRTAPITAVSLGRVVEPIAALLIELPQRELGGTLPTYDELVAQVAWARSRGAAVHLDGARLWEAWPYYEQHAGKSIAEIAALFDTVYVSFYKGLAGLSGCCVAGDRDVIDELSVWRTRHGGRLFMMWPSAASARTALRERLPLMPANYKRAVAIAKAIKSLDHVEVQPQPPQSPMMHLLVRARVEDVAARAMQIAKRDGVWTFLRPFESEGPMLQRYEFQVGAATMAFTIAEVADVLAELVTPTRRPRR